MGPFSRCAITHCIASCRISSDALRVPASAQSVEHTIDSSQIQHGLARWDMAGRGGMGWGVRLDRVYRASRNRPTTWTSIESSKSSRIASPVETQGQQIRGWFAADKVPSSGREDTTFFPPNLNCYLSAAIFKHKNIISQTRWTNRLAPLPLLPPCPPHCLCACCLFFIWLSLSPSTCFRSLCLVAFLSHRFAPPPVCPSHVSSSGPRVWCFRFCLLRLGQ